MTRFKVSIFQHGFQVKAVYSSDKSYLLEFCKRYTQFEYLWNPQKKRRMLMPTSIYATASPDRMTFGFMLEDLNEFKTHLKISGIPENACEYSFIDPPEGIDITFSLPGVTARENQLPALDFLMEPAATRVLPLPTGQGKTLTTLIHLAMLGKRTIFFMKACHIKTWIDTLREYTDVKKDEIVVVKGISTLNALIGLAEIGNLNVKFIIISSTTFNNYLETYINGFEATGLEFSVKPENFVEVVGAGVIVTDECHELIQQVVRRSIMLNVKKHIYLSATLNPGRILMEKVYKSVFPIKDRFTGFKNNNHIVVHPVYYHLKNARDAKYQGSQGYSHLTYEAYILENMTIRTNYLSMISDMVEEKYVSMRLPGMRCLIFASTVNMCEAIKKYLAHRLGDSIGVSTYNADTPDEVLDDAVNAEIIVTTPGSCGTGKDIPNLAVSFMTIALGSRQLAEQILGRTRPIKLYPDIDPEFYYFTCSSIPRHLDYDKQHQSEFKNKSKEIDPIILPVYI